MIRLLPLIKEISIKSGKIILKRASPSNRAWVWEDDGAIWSFLPEKKFVKTYNVPQLQDSLRKNGTPFKEDGDKLIISLKYIKFDRNNYLQ